MTTASDILSSQNAFLDEDQAKLNLKAKAEKTAKWEILRQAPDPDWALRFDQAHGTVTGDLLRTKATEFWNALPEYQGLECPKWSDGWLSGFKSRFNFHRRQRLVRQLQLR